MRPIKCQVCIHNRSRYGELNDKGKPSVHCPVLFKKGLDLGGFRRATMRPKEKARVNNAIKDFVDNCPEYRKKWYLFFTKIRDRV